MASGNNFVRLFYVFRNLEQKLLFLKFMICSYCLLVKFCSSLLSSPTTSIKSSFVGRRSDLIRIACGQVRLASIPGGAR